MKSSNFFVDFKKFILRGNVIDMAVGVVVGGAFSKIVSSLVGDIVMPAISLLTGKVNLSDLAMAVPASQAGAEPILIKYGMFLQNVLDFLIIAFCVFVAVRLFSRFRKKQETPPPAPAEPVKSPEELLLTEIRDLLKTKQE